VPAVGWGGDEIPELNAYISYISTTNNFTHEFAPFLLYCEFEDKNRGVIIAVKGPQWVADHLAQFYTDHKWVGVYDPILKKVIVLYSNTPELKVGELVEIPKKYRKSLEETKD